jgi:hypothetical protein
VASKAALANRTGGAASSEVQRSQPWRKLGPHESPTDPPYRLRRRCPRALAGRRGRRNERREVEEYGLDRARGRLGPARRRRRQILDAPRRLRLQVERWAGVAVAADAFFGSVECTTLEFDADVKFSGLTRAIVAGTVTDECFDFESETVSPYRAEFDVVWRGPGRATKERSQEQGCARKATSRDSAADGSFTWSAPDLRLSGSATSIVATEMFELRDRCRSS